MFQKIVFILIFSLFFISCGDEESSEDIKCGDGICSENLEDINSCPQDCAVCGDQICTESVENSNNCSEDCSENGERVVKNLSINLHEEPIHYISLLNYTATDSTNFHFAISKSGAGPIVILAPDVSAVNSGDETTFFDVTEADPNLDYQHDDGEDYVIGATWRTGGTGSTGFTMSKNIYILKLNDNSYAKLEILSAVAGLIEFRVFRDPEGGTDLTCSEE